MKRTWIYLTLLCCLFSSPVILSANSVTLTTVQEEDELPWSVVEWCLHQVEDRTAYTFTELVDWYQIGQIDVDEVAEGFWVHGYDDNESVVSVLLENL